LIILHQSWGENLKKTAITVLILVSLLAMIGTSIVPNPSARAGNTTTKSTMDAITSMRDPGSDVTDTLLLNRNFTDSYWNSTLSRSMPLNWKYTAGSPSKPSTTYYSWTSSYGYSYGSAYAYISATSSGTTTWTFDWWQNFFYNGTLKGESPTSAYLSFRYYILNIRYASSSNYLRVYLRFPNSTSYQVWSQSIMATTSWTLVCIDVKNLITQAGNGTYRITMRYDGNIYQQNGYTYFLWDDTGLTIQHPPKVRPSDLELLLQNSLDGGSLYTNSTSVKLSVSGSSLGGVGFSNTYSVNPNSYTWNLYQSVVPYPWSLSGASVDGNKTVYFMANNSVGFAGPVNSTILYDHSHPTAPVLQSPINNVAISIQTPMLTWNPSQAKGPSGLANYTVFEDTTPSFNSGNLRIRSTNNSFWQVTFDLVEGQWYWRVSSGSRAGNLNWSTIGTIWIDVTPPGPTSLLSPADGSYTNNNTLVLAWDASSVYDGGSKSSGITSYTLEYSKDPLFGSGVTTVAGLTGSSYRIPTSDPLSDGPWYWRVQAVDRAGNPGAWTVTPRLFTVDTVAPAPPSASFSVTPGSKPTFSWAVISDAVKYIIMLDDSSSFTNSTGHARNWTVDTNSFPIPFDLSNGNWYWQVASEDLAGNIGSFSSPQSFVVNVIDPLMVTAIAGGGTGGIAVFLILGYYFIRRSRIPFVIKKLDQSIKLIGKGEMPQPVPMRTRSQIVASIFQEKLSILSKERLEEPGKKQQKIPKKSEATLEIKSSEAPAKKLGEVTEKRVPETEAKIVEGSIAAESEEADVALIAKELEKLETKGETEPARETDFIRREIEDLEKEAKKKKKKGN
jgi:hypothetical protein